MVTRNGNVVLVEDKGVKKRGRQARDEGSRRE